MLPQSRNLVQPRLPATPGMFSCLRPVARAQGLRASQGDSTAHLAERGRFGTGCNWSKGRRATPATGRSGQSPPPRHPANGHGPGTGTSTNPAASQRTGTAAPPSSHSPTPLASNAGSTQ
jgi:hypothetical protein